MHGELGTRGWGLSGSSFDPCMIPSCPEDPSRALLPSLPDHLSPYGHVTLAATPNALVPGHQGVGAVPAKWDGWRAVTPTVLWGPHPQDTGPHCTSLRQRRCDRAGRAHAPTGCRASSVQALPSQQDCHTSRLPPAAVTNAGHSGSVLFKIFQRGEDKNVYLLPSSAMRAESTFRARVRYVHNKLWSEWSSPLHFGECVPGTPVSHGTGGGPSSASRCPTSSASYEDTCPQV